MSKSVSKPRRSSSSKVTEAKELTSSAHRVAKAVEPVVKALPPVVKAVPPVAKAVGPVVRRAPKLIQHVPQVTQHARSAAVGVGSASVGLAVTGAAAHALRHRRRQTSRVTRVLRQGRRVMNGFSLDLPRPSLPGRHRGPSLLDPRELLPDRSDALWLAAVPVGFEAGRRLRQARRIPIQRCIDIAVPLDVAYREWMRLDFLPEGAHRVEKISRSGEDRLSGRVKAGLLSRLWEAEIADERDGESFAWRSTKGSDCAGLITFHDVSERLTRLELQLDIVPVRPLEASALVLHLADARAQAELRRFKARLETINPDTYDVDEGPEGDDDSND